MIMYSIDCIMSKKNENSVNLNIVYTKKWEYFKIQIVIFDLLQQKNISNDFNCVVWIDNLFTSIDVIVTCKHIDFEIVDIVRTIKTKREELKEKQNIKVQKQRKKFNRNLNTCFANLKLKHKTCYEHVWQIDLTNK